MLLDNIYQFIQFFSDWLAFGTYETLEIGKDDYLKMPWLTDDISNNYYLPFSLSLPSFPSPPLLPISPSSSFASLCVVIALCDRHIIVALCLVFLKICFNFL
jgi:hypothetical protein